MPHPFTLIALDADDTLWHNEPIFHATQAEFRTLLAAYHDPAWIDARLYDAETRNLKHYGYGIKGFILSMIETAVELTEGRVGARRCSRSSTSGAPCSRIRWTCSTAWPRRSRRLRRRTGSCSSPRAT